MHARLLLLLATLAGAVAVPTALLVDEQRVAESGPRPQLGSVLRLEPRARPDGLPLPQPERHPVSVRADEAALDRDHTDLDQLRAALASAHAEIEQLEAELASRDSLWEARLGRSRLEDDLVRMLERDFPDIVAEVDPNSGTDKIDEMVDALKRVAHWLEPEPLLVDGVARHGPPVTLERLRQHVSDFTIRQLAGRLRWWNLQLALAPGVSYWVACGNGGGSSGCTLSRVAQVGNEVVELEEIALAKDDPRIEIAKRDRQRVADARARELEAILGVPWGTFD